MFAKTCDAVIDSHSHGHSCTSHQYAHHAEKVWTVHGSHNEKRIGDPVSLELLIKRIEHLLDQQDSEHVQVQLRLLKGYVGELRDISKCTRKMCYLVSIVERLRKVRVSASDFDF